MMKWNTNFMRLSVSLTALVAFAVASGAGTAGSNRPTVFPAGTGLRGFRPGPRPGRSHFQGQSGCATFRERRIPVSGDVDTPLTRLAGSRKVIGTRILRLSRRTKMFKWNTNFMRLCVSLAAFAAFAVASGAGARWV